MKKLQQIAAVTLMNLRSLPQRFSTSLVIVIGIGGVVAVLVSVLAMATGMIKTLQNAGRDDRVIVLANGSTSEVGSGLPRAAAQVILNAPGIKRDADGQPIVSVELVRPIKVRKRGDGSESSAVFRGVGPQFEKLRPELRIEQGRMFRQGVNEVIVGKGATKQFEGLQVGSTFAAGSVTWTVVGVFSSADSHESELLTDTETLMTAFRRNAFSSATAALESSASLRAFADFLSTNPDLFVDAHRESDFYTKQSESNARLVTIVAYVIGGIMAAGAMFGALNTMYTAVSTRAREIATLRAIGFGSSATVIPVLVEALLLATVGGCLGALGAWIYANGNSLSASAGAGLPIQLVFEISVDSRVMLIGIAWAATIGLVGGLLPAIRAARLPIATALRAV